MMRTTLQYFLIFFRSASIDFFPSSSFHLLAYLVKAFFFALYLKS